MQEALRNSTYYALQNCFANAPPPIAKNGDGCHPTDSVGAHVLCYDKKGEKEDVVFEACGVSHFAIWPMQGHPNVRHFAF